MSALPKSRIELPGYVVDELLGEGGFGQVYRARHAVIGRTVAIKILHAKYSKDPAAVARFVAEARAVNQISHPNIVQISDFGELADGRQYCVMELIEGRTLRDILRERGRLPLAEALPILRGIAEAVDAAHAANIAHRDLKPDNVFVLDSGQIKLIDFGLAKLMNEEVSVTQSGAVFGTPLYMSPEQCRGRAITKATDVYSFGALAYHVLAGTPPFTGEPLDLAVQHINDRPQPPSTRCSELGARVDAVLLEMLEKSPARRPQTLVAAVEALSGGRRVRRKKPALYVALGLVVLAGGGLLVARRPHARVERWSTRTLRLDLDGTTTAIAMTPDGSQLIYNDASGWWRYDLRAASAERLQVPAPSPASVAPMADGTLLVSNGPRTRSTERYDPRDHSVRPVMDAWLPAMSPDGRTIAGWDGDGWLVVHDPQSGTTRRLTQLSVGVAQSPPHWSPDGALLVWGRGGVPSGISKDQAFVTRVADGQTTALPIEVRAKTTTDFYDSATFLTDGRVVYCAADVPEIRARSLATGTEVTLATIDAGVSECNFQSRGRGLFVTLGYSQSTVGQLDLGRAAGQPAVFEQIAGPTRLAIADTAADRVYVHTLASTAEADLRTVTYEGNTLTTVRGCPGETSVVRRGDTVLDFSVVREQATIRLRSLGDCALVDEWVVPRGARRYGAMRCSPSWCAIGVTYEDHVVIWRLEHGRPPTQLATVPSNNNMFVRLAIAPDMHAVAALVMNRVVFVSADGGVTASVPFDDSSTMDGIAWGADPRPIVSGQSIDGAAFALVHVAPDGTREALWSSKATYAGDLVTDPAGHRLFATISTWHQEFLVLDPD